MHTALRIGDGNVMASDGCSEELNFKGFSLSLTVASEAEAGRIFGALAEGGQVHAPRQNFLVSLFRYGRRPLWRRVDGQRHALRRVVVKSHRAPNRCRAIDHSCIAEIQQ